MTTFHTIPLWLTVPIAILLISGATMTFIGALGLLRLQNFYDRLHAPTLATSWGTGGIIMASALLASYMEGRPVLHELTIGFAVLATVPVTLMLLGRAALYRDKAEQSPELPDILRSAALPDSGEHVESTE